jgi:GNAT superfamily N-acetyltransferase
MREADLPAVSTIATAVHPAHPESEAVFAERLSLAASGCLMLEFGGLPAGYVLAHPWHRKRPPALNTLLGTLPRSAEVLYLHDIALLPAARGTGAGGEAIRRLAAMAGRLPMALVALGGTEEFWRHQGFAVVPDPALEAVLRRYDPEAHYMEKPPG